MSVNFGNGGFYRGIIPNTGDKKNSCEFKNESGNGTEKIIPGGDTRTLAELQSLARNFVSDFLNRHYTPDSAKAYLESIGATDINIECTDASPSGMKCKITFILGYSQYKAVCYNTPSNDGSINNNNKEQINVPESKSFNLIGNKYLRRR